MAKYKKWKYPGVRRTPSKNWEISYFPFKGAKNKIYKSLSGDLTEKQANDERLRLLIIDRNKNQATGDKRNLMSADFVTARQELLDGLFDKQGQPLPKKTQSKFRLTFDRMFIDFRNLKYLDLNNPRQLTLRFFEEYRNYFCGARGLNRARGWRAEVIMIKAILRRLYKLGYIDADLILKVKEAIPRPRQNQTPYYELTDSQMKDILIEMKKLRPDFWNLARFQYSTGRRVEECTRIERTDVRWQDGIKLERLSIRSETTKMKEDAPIWILADLEDIVRTAYLNSNQQKSPYLFLNRTGRKINQRDYNDCLREVSKRVCGVPITTKYFRKRFMTECQKKGVPLKDAMAVSGLRDEGVALKHYSYPTKEGQEKALEAMSLK